ncbi:hypothetical protein QJS04_geneDACA010798 [Acorus gramineus]|uniref:Uncharacterized protein n=1 Tax=Acorus gramineus TaxID=55184 RepID=A0AAV9BAQ1_ACOGR|nr:hypothetical protein QJS04_geneDACA010798 [Acorus gramineus]
MADLFKKQAKKYSDSRPGYPNELFRFIASKTPKNDLVWDVGTGSGQATVSDIILQLLWIIDIKATGSRCLLLAAPEEKISEYGWEGNE